MNSEKAKIFFENYIGGPSSEFVTLAQSGSSRVNFSAKNENQRYIITYNENIQENKSFFYFSEIFSHLKLNTPHILLISPDQRIYIQEFLGDYTLSEIISKEGLSQRVIKLVKQTLEKLFQLQTKTKGKIDYNRTFEYKIYDDLPITHDLYYFKNFVADVLEIEYHKSALLKEFKKLVSLIEAIEPKGLMIRDFQSRNILVNKDNEVAFIDYQAAMKGPLIYDVISFLFQAKANFPKTFTQEMLDFYIHQFEEPETRVQLKDAVEPIQLMRFLQVLGAYGFRGLIQRKSHFISSIEKGIENITDFAKNWKAIQDFPELEKVILQLETQKIKQKINDIIHH
ncbi:phosphotransferase [Chryseobacterium sp.]|uniref:aminoglycoside phosphotransferase family protein n=1 Tax=Chryseobacterium sp. TaxID=1871047 RepID=UPI0025B7CC6F|nr:phosphotransferase [Chryseobacterium sp.]